MSRIVAGEAKGRRLAVPDGRDTRPTPDRVREALFSSLEAELGTLAGMAFLDLYAGSGAIGLEALSRGAVAVQFVEVDRHAVAVLKRNVEAVGLPGATVTVGPVERVLGTPPTTPYDVAFLDPPYALPSTTVHEVLRALVAHRWLAPGALVIVERATRDGTRSSSVSRTASRKQAPFDWPASFAGDRSRRYGDTTLWYGHVGTGS